MNFREAENHFRELERRWNAGQVDAAAYQSALVELRVVDANGETWMMQEHTGRWFVYRDGNWVLMAPPTPAQVKQSQPAARQEPPSTKKGRGWKVLLVLGLVGICALCAGGGVAGYLMYNNGTITLPREIGDLLPETLPNSSAPALEGEPAGESAELAPAGIKEIESVSAAADGTPVTDSHGVSLVVPEDAVEEGMQVDLAANDLNAPWVKEVESAVSIDTPFYSLSAQGKSDSNGSLSLSFPAANPNSRLLAVIDDNYLVELAQAPQDGKFTIQTRAAPTDRSELALTQDIDGSGSIYYAVITPKSGAHLSDGSQMAAWNASGLAVNDERNCIPDLSIIGGAAVNLCRQNPAGTVQVMLPTKHRDLLPQVDIMVDKVEAAMTKYAELGFTTAQLSHSSPMLLRVSAKATSPSYYPMNGVLYIPLDTVSQMASESPSEVYHEMAHWIQAVKYSTQLAYWSQERTWWLETSAENMVMLLDPAYQGQNLLTYGAITTSDNALAFQFSPYQWPADFYVHAQIVKLNMCDNPTCPLSQASFAKAISEGAYPLMNGTAKSLIGQNLTDYAYYLLGKFPVRANTAISLNGPVKTGEGYGEYVKIKRTNSSEIDYEFNGYSPQMLKESIDGKDAVAIQASIQRDGVYPLTILGGTGDKPGLPVQLVIEPGASFYYTLDDGELKYSDGSAELKLLPIHGIMGYKKVRIVALGINGGEVFKARVEPLSLEGAWAVVTTGGKTGGGLTCSGGAAEDENPDGGAELMALIMYMMSGTGDMLTDPTGQSLDWNQVSSRVPPAITEANLTFQATALIAGDGVKYQAKVDIPRSESESSLPPAAAPLATAALLPLAWLWRKRIDLRWVRVSTNLLVIAFLVLVSTACVNIYGDSSLDATFTRVEYVGGEDTGVIMFSDDANSVTPQGNPLWRLTGSGTYDVSIKIETPATDEKGQNTTNIETCSGKITFPIAAYIYKDMVVNIPDE